MSRLPYIIHDFVTTRRRKAVAITGMPTQIDAPTTDNSKSAKEYPRMPRIALPKSFPGSATLEEALRARISKHEIMQAPLPIESLAAILYPLSINERGSRLYPSGGAKYPIETYMLAQRVEGLERGAYHYHPYSHSLEHLWPMRDPLSMFSAVNAWAEDARAIIIFTASWWKNNEKYDDFGYLLGMLETGHAAQNVLLATSALKIPSCPLAGLDDDAVTEILDLDKRIEQPLYSIALG